MNRLFNVYWGAILIGLPFFIRVANGIRPELSKSIAFFGALMLSILIFGVKFQRRLDFYALIALSFLSYFTMFDERTVATFFQFAFFNAGLLVLAQFMSMKVERKIILNALAICCLLSSLCVLLNVYGVDWYSVYGLYADAPGDYGIVGPLGNRLHSAGLIMITLPALCRSKWAWTIVLPLGCLQISGSALGILGAGTGLAFLILCFWNPCFAKRIIISGFVIGLLIFTFFGLPYGGFLGEGGRILVWKDVLSSMHGAEIFGNGLGYFIDRIGNNPKRFGEVFTWIHNDYLELYCAFGLAGIACILPYIHRIATSKDNLVIAAMLSMAVYSFGGFGFHLPCIFLCVVAWYSLIDSDKQS